MCEIHNRMQGYPGESEYNGGPGGRPVALLRSSNENVLIDTGHYMHRDLLRARLEEHGLRPNEIDAIAISHCHWDHCMNFPLFPRARIFVGRTEMERAAAQEPGAFPIAELH